MLANEQYVVLAPVDFGKIRLVGGFANVSLACFEDRSSIIFETRNQYMSMSMIGSKNIMPTYPQYSFRSC